MAKKRGRPSGFSQELAHKICALLAEGMTLRQVCKGPGMPHSSTVIKWALEDREGFYQHYAKAREIGYMQMADEIIDIADDGSNDWMEREGRDITNGEALNRSRLRVDTRKWLLSKALPKIYGDKLTAKLEQDQPTGEPNIRDLARAILTMGYQQDNEYGEESQGKTTH